MYCSWMDELGVLHPFQQYFSHIGTMVGWIWKALCNEAPIRLGKNLAWNGIRTRCPVDRSREHVLKIGLKLSIFGHGVALHAYSLAYCLYQNRWNLHTVQLNCYPVATDFLLILFIKWVSWFTTLSVVFQSHQDDWGGNEEFCTTKRCLYARLEYRLKRDSNLWLWFRV